MPTWLIGLHPIPETWSPCLVTLEGHSSSVLSVAFSRNGQFLASGSLDHAVRLWDIPTGTPYSTLSGHSNWVSSVACSPNSKLVASGSYDHIVRLWNVIEGTLYVLRGHVDRIDSVVFSPDGQLIVSGSHDNTMKVWDTTTGTVQTTLESYYHEPYIGLGASVHFFIVFSPDGHSVMSGSTGNTVKLYDTTKGTLRAKLEGHSDKVTSVSYSPNSQLIASKSQDSTIIL